jgi:hypothetical protein
MNTIIRVRESLITVFDELDSWFDKPEIICSFKPAPDEWSINENLEHITLTSHFLMIVIKNGVAKCLKRAQTQAISEGESDLDFMAAIGVNDSFYWHRPEHMIPKGDKPMSELRKIMRQQQAECLVLLDSMPHGEGKLHTVRMSVHELGKIDMYQWLYFVALHAQRHLQQIEQVYALWKTEKNQ